MKHTYIECWYVYSGFQDKLSQKILQLKVAYLFPSTTSTKSSAVAFGSRIATSALLILYSLSTALISSWSMCVNGTVLEIATPPFSFFRTRMAGGFLFS